MELLEEESCREGSDAADVGCKGAGADSGLAALVAVAAFYHIPARQSVLARELALQGPASCDDLLLAARLLGLKARVVCVRDEARLSALPKPALAVLLDGGFSLYAGPAGEGAFRLVDPIGFTARDLGFDAVQQETGGRYLLVQRRFRGPGKERKAFGFRWFLPSIWKYRRALGHVLLASLFIQIFALVTPLFFQIVVDKVLAHRSYSTLIVLVIGLAAISLFDVVLQYLRTYALSHTTNRIDVELGRRLFRHLLNLPLSYFETRAAGQTVARMRELETIRDFLTGKACSAGST